MRILMLVPLVLLSACSSSATPPETPTNDPSGDASAEAAPAAPSESPPSPPAKQIGGSKDNVPDDYIVSDGDCVELGKQYGAVTRSDLEAQLSPKLSQKVRDKTQKSINAAGEKMDKQAFEACKNGMAGKTTDPKMLKCALSASTAKAFDLCLNGEPPPPPKKK